MPCEGLKCFGSVVNVADSVGYSRTVRKSWTFGDEILWVLWGIDGVSVMVWTQVTASRRRLMFHCRNDVFRQCGRLLCRRVVFERIQDDDNYSAIVVNSEPAGSAVIQPGMDHVTAGTLRLTLSDS